MKAEVYLLNPKDTYHFCIGDPISRELVVVTPFAKLKRKLARALWWRQQRSIIVAIDRDAGTITVKPLEWSWRHWMWRLRDSN